MLRVDMRSNFLNGRAIAIGLFVIAFVAIVMLLAGASPRTDDSYGAWILKDWTASGPSDIVLLGDSQLGGMRAADARRAGRKLDFVLDHRGYELEAALQLQGPASVFVSSQPGCLLSDYYAILRGLLDQSSPGQTPRLVILTVSPRILLTNGLSCAGESDYYRFFSTVTNLDDAQGLAYPTILDGLVGRVGDKFGKQLASVKPSQFIFLPDDKQVYQERLLIPANFRFDRVSTEHQMRFLQKTIAYLRSKKIDCLIVLMPILEESSNRQYRNMSAELCERLQSLALTENFSFVSMNDATFFQKDDFLDSIHLSQQGGTTFAKALAGYLKQSGLLPVGENWLHSARR